MKLRFFTKREETPLSDGQAVAHAPNPGELTDTGIDPKTRNLLIVGAVIIAIMFLSRACAGGDQAAQIAHPEKLAAPTSQSLAGVRADMQNNVRRLKSEAQNLDAMRDRYNAMTDSPSEDPNKKNADALADAQRQRREWEAGQQGGGQTPVDQEKQREAEERRKALFEGNFYDKAAAHDQPEQVASALPIIRPKAPERGQNTDEPEAEAERALPPLKRVATSSRDVEPLDFDPAKSKLTWLRSGTVIEGVLTNALDGEQLGPVNVAVTKDVYIPYSKTLVIPQGSIVLGTAKAVNSQNDQRLVVTFNRILTPGLYGYGIPLERPAPGLSQDGAAGLHDKVNRHFASIFGASLAIGAIGAVAQIGNGGSFRSYDPSVEMRNGISQSMGQSANRVLDRFLQRLPTVTIRKGARVEVMLIGDLPLPIPLQPAGSEVDPDRPPVPRLADARSSVQ
jgi:type IV secretory pathway VirB10-like protein